MADFSGKPTLRCRRVLLRAHTPADIEAMGAVLADSTNGCPAPREPAATSP